MSALRFLVLALVLSCAATAAESDPVHPAREILADQDPAWYEAERDDWRRVEIHRRDPVRFESGAPLQILPMVLYGVIALALVALVVWLLMSAGDAPELRLPRSGTGQRPMADLADLPFDVADTGDPEGALAAALAAGEWRVAVIWLYACLLLRLDALGRLRLHRSKTNRCYLQELAPEDPQRGLLDALVATFEATYFGGREPQAQRVHELYADYRAFVAGLGVLR